MSKTSISLLIPVTLFLAGCELGQQPKAAVPPTPAPVAPKAPAPIVENQTVAQLPSPQAVPPESVPPRPRVEYHPPEPETEAPAQPVQAPAVPAPVRPRPKKPAATVTEQAAPETAEAPPPATLPAQTGPPSTPPTGAEERAAPAVPRSAESATLNKAQIGGLLDEVRKLVEGVLAQNPAAGTRQIANRINSMVRLSEESSAHEDLRQSEALARRALALARDLGRAK